MADGDVNKRAVENFIKAGALDSLGGTRKQFMSVYGQIMDRTAKDKKNNLAGQMTLFDIASEENKEEFDIRMPDVGEYNKEMLLAFEKEVLGIYISGHPLEEYRELWQKYISHTTNDFMLDEETGEPHIKDQTNAVIGGMIADKKIKYTKNDKVMAFLNVEDLVGNVEVVVFPGDYERYGNLLMEDAKVFIRGRASVEEDKDGKLICEKIVSFEEVSAKGDLFGDRRFPGNGRSAGVRRPVSQGKSSPGKPSPGKDFSVKVPDGVWLQFEEFEDYKSREKELLAALADSDGNDDVVIYIKKQRNYKILPPNLRVNADEVLRSRLNKLLGEENVKFRRKAIENSNKMH